MSRWGCETGYVATGARTVLIRQERRGGRGPGDELAHPAFQLQSRNEGGEFDVFLEDIDEGMWHYRRNPGVRRPVHGVLVVAPSSIPVVRPEVQLLCMAKSSDSKNEADFVNALPHLDTTARNWLRGALRLAHPEHSWIARL